MSDGPFKDARVTRSREWRSSLGETDEQNRERRTAQKQIVAFLRSDLYEPCARLAEGNEAVFVSPLNWRVRFQVEPTTWRCVVEAPDGSEYARLERPTVEDLDAVVP